MLQTVILLAVIVKQRTIKSFYSNVYSKSIKEIARNKIKTLAPTKTLLSNIEQKRTIPSTKRPSSGP